MVDYMGVWRMHGSGLGHNTRPALVKQAGEGQPEWWVRVTTTSPCGYSEGGSQGWKLQSSPVNPRIASI